MSSAPALEIVIQSPLPDVIEVLLDFNGYPAWSGLDNMTVVSRSADLAQTVIRFEISAAGLTDVVQIMVTKSADSTLEWELVESDLLTELKGIFRLTALDSNSCAVAYELELRFKNPFFNAMKKSAEVQMAQKILNRLSERMAQI